MGRWCKWEPFMNQPRGFSAWPGVYRATVLWGLIYLNTKPALIWVWGWEAISARALSAKWCISERHLHPQQHGNSFLLLCLPLSVLLGQAHSWGNSQSQEKTDQSLDWSCHAPGLQIPRGWHALWLLWLPQDWVSSRWWGLRFVAESWVIQYWSLALMKLFICERSSPYACLRWLWNGLGGHISKYQKTL